MTSGGIKITVLTWLKDEEHILPFFLRHYAFADRIIAWDNGSTDRSREILASDPRVEIRDWDSGGELRDDQLLQMKNEEYRKTGDGWNFIVDADEFVYHQEIIKFLDFCEGKGVTLPLVQGFDMVSDKVPVDDGSSKLTDLVPFGRPSSMYNKLCVVRSNCFITYSLGAHMPVTLDGRVISTDGWYLKLLHYRYLSVDLVVEKARKIKLSEFNRTSGTAIAQSSPIVMKAKWEDAWNNKSRVLP